MTRIEDVRADLARRPRAWLVTGAAGFIGSHLVEELLRLGQRVRGLDDLSTGSRENLDDVRAAVGEEAFERFELLEADIRELASCRAAAAGCELVLHQAALGSVPRSLADPLATHAVNVGGSLNVLVAARDAGARRVVYASSSSVYGDHPGLPKHEDEIGQPLSPYAASKLQGEILAGVFGRCYGLETVGLRYFNVFGPRQDPAGAYAAVIPRWIGALLAGEAPVIHGDGETSRDFCPVAEVVAANLLAALAPAEASGEVFNVALGGRTTLNELLAALRAEAELAGSVPAQPVHGPPREGDVRHSQADLARVRSVLGFEPRVDVPGGLAETFAWFAGRRAGNAGAR